MIPAPIVEAKRTDTNDKDLKQKCSSIFFSTKTKIIIQNGSVTYLVYPRRVARSAAVCALPPSLQWKITSWSGLGLSWPNLALNSSAERFKACSSVGTENVMAKGKGLQSGEVLLMEAFPGCDGKVTCVTQKRWFDVYTIGAQQSYFVYPKGVMVSMAIWLRLPVRQDMMM